MPTTSFVASRRVLLAALCSALLLLAPGGNSTAGDDDPAAVSARLTRPQLRGQPLSAAPAPPPACTGDSNGAYNDSMTFTAFPAPNLVPWPLKIELEDGYYYLNSSTVIALSGSQTANLTLAGNLLASEIALATGGALSPKVVTATGFTPNAITLFIMGPDDLAPAASRVQIAAHGAELSGGDYVGLMSATASFLQALELGQDTDGHNGVSKPVVCKSPAAPAWRVPTMEIDDKPAFGIRGVMVDAARAYLPLAQLKQYVVLCRIYKLNHLHIHLSDGGSFTFPSTKYPELAAKAKFAYKLEELQELQTFARARGVTLIGEIDVPGHSSGLTDTLPKVFAFPSKPSVPVINFVDPDVVAAIQTIYDEIEEVFPSGYSMMGGDEVPLASIQDLPEIKAAAAKLQPGGNATGYDLYRQFIVEMHSYATKAGRELIVWEGFAPADGQTGRSAHPASKVAIPTEGLIVTPFDCFYYPPPQLAADGYKILNSAWTPLYIAGGTGQSPELIYKWNPWLLGEFPGHVSWWKIPKESRQQIIGVKMAVWSTIANDTLCALSGRLPAMADRSWNPAAARTYADYQVRVSATTVLLSALLGLGAPAPPTNATKHAGCVAGCTQGQCFAGGI